MLTKSIQGLLKLIAVTAFAAPLLAIGTPATAQDPPTVEKRENSVYYSVNYIKFKPGAATRAYEIIYDHFLPAATTSGGQIVVIDFQTGPWDSAVYILMPDGPAAFEWITTEGNEKFWAALAEQEGGVEAARALFARYYDLVDHIEVELAHRHLDQEEETAPDQTDEPAATALDEAGEPTKTRDFKEDEPEE